MVDHHVDRPEVEAGQPVQLTGTNRSIGLIHTGAAPPRPTTARVQRPAPSGPAHAASPAPCSSQGQALRGATSDTFLPRLTSHRGLAGLVAIARGQTPDPIPNSAVKTLCAHGTATQAVEE